MGMNTDTCSTYRPGRSGQTRSALHAMRRLLQLAARTLGRWCQRRRQRAALAELDKRLLNDVGLSRSDVAYEVAKPFWRE